MVAANVLSSNRRIDYKQSKPLKCFKLDYFINKLSQKKNNLKNK